MEFLAIKLLDLWRSLSSVYPRSFHSLVSYDFDSSPEPAWLREIAISRNTYGTTNRLSSLDSDAQVCRLRSSLRCHPASKQKLPYKATRATLPETGRRETTCTTARIKHQDLPGFRLNNPPPAGRGKLVEICSTGYFLGLFTKAPRKSGREKMILIAVKAVLADSRPPAVDDSIRTSQGWKMRL